jgi:hypothetical protein
MTAATLTCIFIPKRHCGHFPTQILEYLTCVSRQELGKIQSANILTADFGAMLSSFLHFVDSVLRSRMI